MIATLAMRAFGGRGVRPLPEARLPKARTSKMALWAARRGRRANKNFCVMCAIFPVAVHLFMLRADQVLLLRRYNTGYEDGNYSVPAGHLNGDETVRQAMIREACEELGVEIQSQNLIFAGVFHRKSDDERVDFFLSAHQWSGTPRNNELEKCDEVQWFPLDALPENMIPYVRRALENYLAGVVFDEFGW